MKANKFNVQASKSLEEDHIQNEVYLFIYLRNHFYIVYNRSFINSRRLSEYMSRVMLSSTLELGK